MNIHDHESLVVILSNVHRVSFSKGWTLGNGVAGQSHSLLDSFEVDLVGTEPISVDRLAADERGNPKALPRVSTSPEDNPRKKPKRKTKTHPLEIEGSTGIAEPSPLDILRGRGGRTNRFPGNRKFRDEARKLRKTYRDHNTTREAKFHLSQVIKLSIVVPRVLSYSHTIIDFYMIAVGKTCQRLWGQVSGAKQE